MPAPLITVAYNNAKPRFVNAAGDQVLLRGVNMLLTAPSSYTVIAAGMGLNCVRLVLNWNRFEATAPTGSGSNYAGYSHTYAASELATLDSFGSYLASQSVYMMIDFHQANWSPYFGGSGVPSWYYTDPRFKPNQNGGNGWSTAQQSLAIAGFWTDTAEKAMAQTLYNAWVSAMVTHVVGQSWSDHVFGYETFNEPNPGGISGSSATKITAMQTWLSTTVDTIRAVDTSRMTFVMCRGGGQGYGTAVFTDAFGSTGTMQSKKMAMEYHAYYTGLEPGKNATSSGQVGYKGPDNDDYYPDAPTVHNTTPGSNYHGTVVGQRAWMSVPIAKAAALGLPVLHGEFGTRYDDPGRLAYQQHIQQVMDENAMSCTAWKLGATPSDPEGLITGGALNDMGLSLKAWFQATDFIIPGGGTGSTGPTNTTAPSLNTASIVDGQTVTFTKGTWSGATSVSDEFQLSADGSTGWATIGTSYSWRKGADYGGGYQMNVATDTGTAGRAFAGGDLWGFYTTTDTGSSWQPGMLGIKIKTTASVQGLYSRAAAWSKKTAGTVYVAHGGLNAGAGSGDFYKISGTWDLASQNTVIGFGTTGQSAANRPRPGGRLIQIDYDGATTEYIYTLASTGTTATVLRSTDAGVTWTTLFSTGITSASSDVTNAAWKSSCLIDSDSDGVPDTLLVASYRDPSKDGATNTGSKVWKITAGSSSIRAATASSQVTTTQVAGAPGVVEDIVNMDGAVYAACGPYGVYRVTNNGSTWTAVAGNATFTTPGYWASSIDGVNGHLVVAKARYSSSLTADPNQVATSTDSGATWTWIVDTSTITHATSGGRICSIPWGETNEWWLIASGAPSFTNYLGGSTMDIQEVRYDQTDTTGHTIYVAGSGGSWLTINGGSTWRPCVVGLNGGEVTHVAPGRGSGDSYCDNQDWKQAVTTDHWATCSHSVSTPTGFTNTGLGDKTDGAGNTYHLDTTQGAPDITRNGSTIADDFSKAALIATADFQVTPDGYVLIAQYAGGVLVGVPGGGGGATTWTVPATVDDGKYVRILETATDSGGHTATATSTVVGPIAAAGSAPVNTTPPTVNKTLAKPGESVTWTPGSWTNTPTSHTYQMQRRQTGSGTILSTVSATTSYTVLVADIGYDIRFKETETNASGSGTPAFSPWTSLISPPVVNPVVPTITLTTPPDDITINAAAGSNYTIAGTATSDTAISVLFVNSQTVTVAGDGSFSRVISLSEGANLVTVVATDLDGDTSTITNTITLVVPPDPSTASNDLLRIERELAQRGLE